ncbi:hypothetical protein GE09DRAFT_1164917 [Coniochaeta sp. 2T2.1]|nr:hypothetical protein GE09DRAFT_1164917 [Coniochaeta sp. 2T2.1]
MDRGQSTGSHQENAAIMSIPVTFTINRELRRHIQLVLESSNPQSYSILIEDSQQHSEARVAIADLLRDTATSHNATLQPQATLADRNEMWPSELIRDTSTVSPTQTSRNRATSSGTSEAAAHSAKVTPEEDKEHEKFTEGYFRRLLSWTPSISSQSEVAAAGNHLQIKRKAADTPAATGYSPTRGRSSKRRRTNEGAPRRSQRLRARQLRHMETFGEYIPLESDDEHVALE